MAAPTRIVDAHHHLWDLKENVYPWLRDGLPHPMFGDNYDLLRESYLIEDFLRDIGDLPILKSVHLQADHDAGDPVRETRWLNEVAERPGARGFPHAIVAYADFFDEDVERTLEEHASFARVRGIRQTLHHRSGDPLNNAGWLRNIKLLKKYGLTFDLQVYPRQLAEGLRLADDNPDIRFILSHSGLPRDLSREGIAEWKDAIVRFASRDNVVCKMSGFGMLHREKTYDFIDEIVHHIMNFFGTDRCFFGSNFPVDRFGGDYRKFWTRLFEITSDLSDSEIDNIYFENASRVYGISDG